MTLRNRTQDWIGDRILGKLLKDSAKLLTGSVVEGGFGFIAVVIAARGLGPQQFGMLVLIQTYIIIIDTIINFKSWEALIKYGTDALESNSAPTFERLIKFGTSLDVGTALLGTVVSLAGIYGLQSWLAWSAEFTSMVAAYCAFILFNITGAPIAILRLFDRFDLLATQKVVAGGLKLVAVTIAFFADANLWGYVAAWLTVDVLGHWILIGLGWRELYRQGFRGVLKVELVGLTSTFPGLWRYVWATNFNSTITMAPRRLDTLVVAKMLGPTAVGLYEVAKKVGKGLTQLSTPLYHAIYPELAKLWSRNDRTKFIRLMARSAGIAAIGALVFWIVLVIWGPELIELSVGVEYLDTYNVLVWYILAVVIQVAGFPLVPGLLAMGYPGKSLLVQSISTVLYFGVLMWMLYMYELFGAGLAYLIFYVFWTGLMVLVEYRLLGQSEGAEASRKPFVPQNS